MGGLAFVFSGQGDQYPGMGRALYETSATARQVFALCEDIRPGTLAQCFTATAEVLREKGIRPDAVAGFSLGEVTAATFAGVFRQADGFRLVCQRGALMQREAEKRDTAMAAVVKLAPQRVRELCAGYPDIFPVNFNCPGQITVSGLAAQMPGFTADVKATGGRCLPLKVRGGFHSPFMGAAAEAFAEALARTEPRKGEIPLYSNVTGEPYGEDVAGLLARQIASPVLWETLIRNMIDVGIDTFVEIGPGKTLTNMIQKIDPGVNARVYTAYLEELPC